ncbi:MAG: glycosyltransferase family 4 protein [Cyclobacteriaceae bacterium]|nr:glycosyltransferase family 4 protein [Cyclobacteriaceae bacterium]
MKKLLYIVSDIDKALSFEWVAKYFASRYELVFVLIGKQGTALEGYLKQTGVAHKVLADSRYQSAPALWWALWRVIRDERPDIVHTHLWRATMFGITASWLAGVRKRIFTRHHGMIHYDLHPSGRKWDRLVNFMATDIIAISGNIRTILTSLDGASERKITMIHHGFDLSFLAGASDAEAAALMDRHGIPQHTRVIGVIARYTHWKGIQYIIPAFAKLIARHQDIHLVLANAHGDYAPEIRQLLGTLPKDRYTEISFEANLPALYRTMFVHVHVPVDSRVEAFGQTYVEALAAGVPSVFSLSGVAPEFIQNGVNALVVDFRDADGICHAVEKLLVDEDLRRRLIASGKTSAESFKLSGMLGKLQDLYD